MATDTTTTLVDGDFAAQIIRDQTRLAAALQMVEHGLYIAVNSVGDRQVLDLREDIEASQGRPDRKRGTVTLTDPGDFAAYLAKHGLPESELWADVERAQVTAVINAGVANDGADEEADAGWGDHRAVLQLKHTQDWADWTKASGVLMAQVDFAEFVEQHLPNCVEPTGASMLELAQTIKGSTKVTWEQTKRVKSGETAIEWREDTTAAAGRKGSLAIPDTLKLGIVVFEGGSPYAVTARFRYRVTSGGLTLGFVLERRRDVLLDAFEQVLVGLRVATDRQVWRGTP